jgi:hypothetical protein
MNDRTYLIYSVPTTRFFARRQAMGQTVEIRYAEAEFGYAEMLGKRIARIVNTPLFSERLCRNAIVRLDRNPEQDDGFPEITEVLHSPYPERTVLRFMEEGEARLLLDLFALLRSDAQVVIPPENGRPGMLVVSHLEGLDPVGLAEAIGISQPAEDEQDS